MTTSTKPRGVLIAGNWKMNHGQAATEQFFRKLPSVSNLAPFKSGALRACVAVPATSLERAVAISASAPYPFAIAAQNAHWEKSGAFTGELSGPLLKDTGIHWALTG